MKTNAIIHVIDSASKQQPEWLIKSGSRSSSIMTQPRIHHIMCKTFKRYVCKPKYREKDQIIIHSYLFESVRVTTNSASL